MEFFDHERTVPNSVLKMFIDLFSSPQTAELFYTNDNKVLIDILVRQLSDLSPGDSVNFNEKTTELTIISNRHEITL